MNPAAAGLKAIPSATAMTTILTILTILTIDSMTIIQTPTWSPSALEKPQAPAARPDLEKPRAPEARPDLEKAAPPAAAPLSAADQFPAPTPALAETFQNFWTGEVQQQAARQVEGQVPPQVHPGEQPLLTPWDINAWRPSMSSPILMTPKSPILRRHPQENPNLWAAWRKGCLLRPSPITTAATECATSGMVTAPSRPLRKPPGTTKSQCSLTNAARRSCTQGLPNSGNCKAGITYTGLPNSGNCKARQIHKTA